jgi:hypothetical protein
MRSTILENVSPSHRMVTHHLKTTFGEKNLESRAFSFFFFPHDFNPSFSYYFLLCVTCMRCIHHTLYGGQILLSYILCCEAEGVSETRIATLGSFVRIISADMTVL